MAHHTETRLEKQEIGLIDAIGWGYPGGLRNQDRGAASSAAAAGPPPPPKKAQAPSPERSLSLKADEDRRNGKGGSAGLGGPEQQMLARLDRVIRPELVDLHQLVG